MSTMLFLNREDFSDGESGSGGYDGWTKGELEAELESRGLPKTGNKPELIERLEEDDAA